MLTEELLFRYCREGLAADKYHLATVRGVDSQPAPLLISDEEQSCCASLVASTPRSLLRHHVSAHDQSSRASARYLYSVDLPTPSIEQISSTECSLSALSFL